MTSISIILPTCGRPTILRAINSALPQLTAGDEIIVIGDGPQSDVRHAIANVNDVRTVYCECGPTHFFGNAQRNLGMSLARGEVIAFLDDDDLLCDGALESIRKTATEHPGHPLMFRLRCDKPKFTIWRTQHLKVGNISGGAFVVPNLPDRLARWPAADELTEPCSDVTFIKSTLARFPADALVWRPEIICHVPQRSHNAH